MSTYYKLPRIFRVCGWGKGRYAICHRSAPFDLESSILSQIRYTVSQVWTYNNQILFWDETNHLMDIKGLVLQSMIYNAILRGL